MQIQLREILDVILSLIISYISCLRLAPSEVDTQAVEGDFRGATLKQGIDDFIILFSLSKCFVVM